MFENDQELMLIYEALAKMYSLRDDCRNEPLWTDEGRRDAVAGVDSQIRKIEREISEYLSIRPEKAA